MIALILFITTEKGTSIYLLRLKRADFIYIALESIVAEETYLYGIPSNK